MPALVGTATGYLQLACLSWFLYDWAITIDREVASIWARKWTSTKVLYVMLRWTVAALLFSETVIYVFLENLSIPQCTAFSWGSAVGSLLVVVEVEVILQLRIYVMYKCSRRVLYFNAVLCILATTTAVVVLTQFLAHWKDEFGDTPSWIIGSCYGVRPRALCTVWIATLCYELYLALLAVYKIVSNHRRGLHITGGRSLLSVLVRDSAIYFFMISGCAVATMVLWSETAVTPGGSAVNIIHATSAVGGARLILNTREAALPPQAPSAESGASTLTANVELKDLRSSAARKGSVYGP